ncbi:hypothetical protein C0Q70_16705 [Pomacea canaliculata]|uniref:Laminin subunit alpha n=1 Tax=Pomacea canaliculata TaxID=400727 RepID=A0A2T7NQK2_POMCA|nr:hypothetical protein C0Q70_16705 [Pomacea canaliculata]
MATREKPSGVVTNFVLALSVQILTLYLFTAQGQVLTPPYFNLAQGSTIIATATCGVDVSRPELFCRLTGATGERQEDRVEVIQGQSCDYCNPNLSDQDHRPEYAIDGTERWWQSPPLSRGMQFNEVNLTIPLGQEFHVAYVFIRMANSPRPGVWVLERSTDFGKTWQPWQYFADTPSDCYRFFNTRADEPLLRDDQVLCTTEFSKVVPLEGGEIVVSLVNGRPSAQNFSNVDALQQWTKATDVQLRMLRTKTLLGHLMAVERQDPTVTRRYYYSIKDISIGGRCVCNGHANSCDRPPEAQSTKLLCYCEHNTCGEQCETCCPGFVQKRWRRARVNDPFECEPCQCYGHASDCIFDEEVERQRRSIDIHGVFEGGGVCQNCQHNTTGINCEKCVFGFYRPYDVPRDAIDACRPCECDLRVSTGDCEEGTGRCFCRPEYTGLNCDRCNIGYYGYPNCIPCDCHIKGTEDGICTVATGICPCKVNYDGRKCDMCALGYYNFPECTECECNPIGSASTKCDLESGQCECRSNYGSRDCGACADGFFRYPTCEYCNCDPSGTVDEICDKQFGECMCKQNYTGERCDRCEPGFYGYPSCEECRCVEPGSRSSVCAESGQCQCKANFAGRTCDRCAAGYYRYPDCIPCQCDLYGSLSVSCEQVTGQCSCRDNFQGQMCDKCKENFYNYPMCEVCNCNPNGAKEIPGYPLGGCGIITMGLLCECKEQVQGRICDQCKPGYWNLNRNNPQGCEACTCYKAGTLTGSTVCDTMTGQCTCKPDVGGRDCDQCRDGFYNLQENNPFGCSNCMCNMGGSQSPVCNKMTGQCRCRPRVTGQKCDQPIKSHFYPDLHQLKLEIEDGVTPEGAQIRYGYDEYIFPGYSWRGYAILTNVQSEVLLDVNIRIPSLYQIIYHYVSRNDNPIRGDITLTPDSPTDVAQHGEIIFLPTFDPKFAKVTSGGVSSFVLNPGRWTVSTKVPNIAFLDYFVLIPQDYYEASVLQQRVTSPCELPGDSGPCLHYQYPDLDGFSSVSGINGFTIVDQQRIPVETYPDVNVTAELGITGLAHLKPTQRRFTVNLYVPKSDQYVLILTYLNPTNRSQHLDANVASLSGTDKAKLTLHSCQYSTLCRQVFKTEDNMVAVFNITTGYVSITFVGSEDVDLGIDSVTAIPYGEWSSEFIRPRIICIRINGICIPSSYSLPVGTARVDFELPPNLGRQTVDIPVNIVDTSVKLVQLNATDRDIQICSTVNRPGRYIILFQYFLPTEIGFDIPVTVYVNGQPVEGIFKPNYCPSISGCRGAVLFNDNNIITLNDANICIVVNNTAGGRIWLDYALIVPAEQHGRGDLELLPIDKSGDFLTMCVNEGFELKDDSRFCQDSVFTLTTEFNKGAVQCDCNVDGSLNFNCHSFGGQCQCRDNVIGRTCSACRPGYYGFPRCKPCNCPFGLCHVLTGECICPPRVEGDHCDRCEPEAYGYDPLVGCQECRCNPRGVAGGNLNCDQITGQCQCLPNVGGRKCDTCLPGYHSFPYCSACDCDPAGTEKDICNQVTSQCLCKAGVVGSRCDQCADGMFHLSSENPRGCTSCFCFGTTTRCVSTSLRWDEVNTMDEWEITNTLDGFVIEAGNTIAVKALNNIVDNNEAMYWVAPTLYLGNKISSYGGDLSYTVLFTLPRDLPEGAVGLVKPDIILMGNNMTIVHTNLQQPVPSTPLDMTISLFEYNFRHAGSGGVVSREQFMMILYSLKALHIRASYFSQVDEVRLSDVRLQIASETGVGAYALSVEQCECPASYQGYSCQNCALGHYRSRSTPYLGICVRCNCNGHTNECDPVTGKCFNCGGNTVGPNCEQCLPGFFGDPTRGDCQMCSCPLPVASNNFASSCVLASDGVGNYCQCFPGYYGRSCESCGPGYFGNPMEIGSTCNPCSCSGNIDTTRFGSCDRFTGQCLKCLNNTAGTHCEVCKDWYWGDAVQRKDCQECSCDQCGSNSCDKQTGFCECKTNIVGSSCDQCAPYTWGFNYCLGCRLCECGLGSVTPQCDLQTGHCECQPGVQGSKCDQCQHGHWNLGPSGCQECNCLSDGAVGCDDKTGRCLCLPGVTGLTCDRCLDRWVLVPGQGCQECDYCIHLLLDDMDILNRNVITVRRQLADVSVGVAAFQRLEEYNNSVSILKPRIAELYKIDQNEMQETLNPLKQGLATVASSAGETLDMANQAKAQSELIFQSGTVLSTEASTAEAMIHEQFTVAENAVQFVRSVLAQIIASIKVTNIETYITEAERILTAIQALDFASSNASVVLELENTKAVLMKIAALEAQAKAQFNITAGTEENIEELNKRLFDLRDKAETEISMEALDNIQRLRAQNLETLQGLKEGIESLDGETQTLLKDSEMLLGEAREALQNATSNLQELGVESSKMQTAVQELSVVVEKLETGVMNVEPLVSQAFLHAQNLQGQAMDLDNLYNNTRDQSANALTAAQAYQNIGKFITAAHNNSNEAIEDAERALNESSGSGEKSAESLRKSRDLQTDADEAFSKTSEALYNDINNARTMIEEVSGENEKVMKHINEIRNELEDLEKGTPESLNQAVVNRSEVTSNNLKGTTERVDRIIALLPEDQHKLESINPNRTFANLKMKSIETNIEEVKNNRPVVGSLVQPLLTNASWLVGIGEKLELNVQALRRKIELAQEQANRIRVGLKFLGNTTVTARNPPKLYQAGSFSRLSLYFKTTQSDGLILYVGGEQPVENFQNDFLSLELEGGLLVYKYNLGSGLARIASLTPVNDGQWHQAIAERTGKTGTLTIRTDRQEDQKVEGTSEGTFAVLELNPATTKFYLGGVPSDVELPVTTTFFQGSLEDIKFDDDPVGLWNFVDAENNLRGELARDVMKEIVSNGMRFNGMGYVVLNRDQLGLRSRKSEIQLQFQTYSESGLLVYMGDYKRDFLSIELKEGRVVFQYDLGGGSVALSSADKYNDGQWHSVTVVRQNQQGLLRMDEKEVDRKSSSGSLVDLSTTQDIFIGGFDQVLVPSVNVGSHGFDGCIQNVVFGNLPWDLNENLRAKGVLRGCPAKVARIATYHEARPDRFMAVDLEGGVGSEFNITFKMRTRQSQALLLYIADEPQNGVFSVSVVDGKIVVRSLPAGETMDLVSRVNTYNDGNWHYVSIMKVQLELTMNIDDSEMLSLTASGSPSLLTTTPIYLGGVPNDYSIKSGAAPTTEHLIGCIGDVTVNEKFVNFANIMDAHRMGVSLVECSIKSDKELKEEQEAQVSVVTPASPTDEEGTPALMETTTTTPLYQCALPLEPSIAEDAEVSGVRFGLTSNSRQEYPVQQARIRIRSAFSVEFKTTGRNGLIFYVADAKHIDFIGLYMKEGRITYSFNCGSGTGTLSSTETYNDGQWHKAGVVSFPGCIRNVRVHDDEFGTPIKETNTTPCSAAYETGTFFSSSGGYVQQFDLFKVGRDMEIKMDVRPRSSSGVLLAVHGPMDYVILQLVEGKVILSADNGAGLMTTVFTPPAVNSLCDGNWHKIEANKNKNVVTLLVDGVQAPEPGIGSAKVTAADTNDPLYIGGLPDKGAKGVLTNETFVGCIRNLHLNDRLQYLASGISTGDVRHGYCPIA